MLRIPLCLCATALLLSAPSASGNEADNIRLLIERLEKAEARIQELERQRADDGESSNDVSSTDDISAFDSENDPVSDTNTEDAESRKDTPTVESLTEEWEKKWNEKWEEQSETNEELKTAIEGSVQPGSSGTKTMRVFGRIHTDYWGFPGTSPGINLIETGDPTATPQDRLGFRRVRIGVGGNVNPNVGYKIEMEFAGGDESEFRDVFISVKELPWLRTVIVGNHKRPYGLDHINSSRYNVFLERPFVIEAFNQDARRLGISSSGFSEDKVCNWQYGVWNQRLIQDEGQYISDHLQGEIAGRLASTYWYDEPSDGRNYAHWAISSTFAHPDGSAGADPADLGAFESQNEARFRHRPEARSVERWLDTGRIDGADWYEMIGLEHVINVGPLQVVGEYQNLFMQRDPGFQDLHLHGGYIYASWFLTGEHMTWDRETGKLDRVDPNEDFFLVKGCRCARGTGWGAWQLAARWSFADFNDKDVFGGVGRSLTLGVNWLLNPNTKLQFNYINGTIESRDVGGVLTGGDYDIVGVRFLIDF